MNRHLTIREYFLLKYLIMNNYSYINNIKNKKDMKNIFLT